MKTTIIIDKAESLSHNQRWKYMIGLGKKSKNDKFLTKSLRELACSEIHYERILALMSAHGSFDKEIITKLLEDSSDIGMFAAIKLAAKHLDSNQLVDIIPRLSKNKQIRISLALLAEKQIDTIEQVYDKLRIPQQDMLFYTSERFFIEHIDQDIFNALTESHSTPT